MVCEDYPDAPRSLGTSREKGPQDPSVDPTSDVYCNGAGSLPDEVGSLPLLGSKPPRFSHGPSNGGAQWAVVLFAHEGPPDPLGEGPPDPQEMATRTIYGAFYTLHTSV